MSKKYRIKKKGTSYKFQYYAVGDEIEFSEEEMEGQQFKWLMDRGMLEPICPAEPEAPPSIEDELPETLLSINDLTEIKGIGPALADKIADEFKTVEELKSSKPEFIADTIQGLSVDLAKDVLEKAKTW